MNIVEGVRRPAYGLGFHLFVVGVFLAPYISLRIADSGLVASDILMLVGGAIMLAHRRPRLRSLTGVYGVWFASGYLIVFGTLLSALLNPLAGLQPTLALSLQYAVVLLFLPAVFACADYRERLWLLHAFLGGLVLSVALGTVLVTFPSPVTDTLREVGILVGRGREGLFTGVSALSKILAMVLPLVYFGILSRRMAPSFAMAMLIMVATGLVIARAGAGLVGVVVAVGSLTALHLWNRRLLERHVPLRRMIMVLTGAAVVIGGAYLWDARSEVGYYERFHDRLIVPIGEEEEHLASVALRFRLMREAGDVIQENLLVGVGPGRYLLSPEGLRVHVVPLLIWAETGLLPLVGWALLCGGLWFYAVKWMSSSPLHSVTLAAAVVTFLWSCVTTTYMYPRAFMLPLLLATFTPNVLTSREKPHRTRLAPVGRAVSNLDQPFSQGTRPLSWSRRRTQTTGVSWPRAR